MQKIFLFFGVFFLFFCSNSFAQNFTLIVNNTIYSFNITGNFTQLQGIVVNITWIPAFDIDFPGLFKCRFIPAEKPTLEESHYQMVCDYDIFIQKEELYVPLPVGMLKEFEMIKARESQCYEIRAWMLFFQLLCVVLVVVLVSYVLYNEYWVYRF